MNFQGIRGSIHIHHRVSVTFQTISKMLACCRVPAGQVRGIQVRLCSCVNDLARCTQQDNACYEGGKLSRSERAQGTVSHILSKYNFETYQSHYGSYRKKDGDR